MSTLHPGVLGAKMKPGNDAKAKTVRDYLVKLLLQVWVEEEGFSGKRPFGNSGWTNDLYWALVKAEIVEGSIFDGYIEDIDQEAADEQIKLAILSLAKDPA